MCIPKFPTVYLRIQASKSCGHVGPAKLASTFLQNMYPILRSISALSGSLVSFIFSYLYRSTHEQSSIFQCHWQPLVRFVSTT